MKAEEKPTEVILNFQAVEGTPRNFVPRERRRFEERREGSGEQKREAQPPKESPESGPGAAE